MVGRDRVVERDADVLAVDRGEVPHLPRRAEIAVHRARRAVFGRVRDVVAVRGRLHRRAALLGHGVGVVTRAGEDVESGVGRVVHERLLARPLRVPNVLADRAPPPGTAPVRVGHDEGRAVGVGLLAERGRLAGVRRRVLDEAVPVEHAEARDVDQAVAAAGDEQRAGCRLGPDDRRRALDGEHGHRRRVGSAGRQRQRLLVEQWVVERRAEARCRSRSARRSPAGVDRGAAPSASGARGCTGRPAGRSAGGCRPRSSAGRSVRSRWGRSGPPGSARRARSSRSFVSGVPYGISSRAT